MRIALLGLAFLSSLALTGVLRRYALHTGMLDHPNARSSHAIPTPRGGGAGFVLVTALGLVSLALLYPENVRVWIALGGGLFVAIVGWADDRQGLSAAVRLSAHLGAAAWAVYWVGGLSSLDLGFTRLALPWIGSILSTVGIAWAINLYNFMDGINGLASGQAIVAGLAAGVMLSLGGHESLATAAWMLAASVAGFFLWNFPTARIFMGDVGSGFLGYIFGTLALATEATQTLSLMNWALLIAVFIVDTAATLLWRMHQGEKWYTAHRLHAYQIAVQRGSTHTQVTSVILALGVLLGLVNWVGWAWPWLLVPLVITVFLGLFKAWRYYH